MSEIHRCINPKCDAHSTDMYNELCETCRDFKKLIKTKEAKDG